MGGMLGTLERGSAGSLTLVLQMSTQQHASGYADRVGQRLRDGHLDIMRGRWRVLRETQPETHRRADGIDVVSVVYHLTPLDAAARGVVARQTL